MYAIDANFKHSVGVPDAKSKKTKGKVDPNSDGTITLITGKIYFEFIPINSFTNLDGKLIYKDLTTKR